MRSIRFHSVSPWRASSTWGRASGGIARRIGDAGLGEPAAAEPARVAPSAMEGGGAPGARDRVVAGQRARDRHAKRRREPSDAGLRLEEERRADLDRSALDAALRPEARGLAERVEELPAAVGIAARVERIDAEVDGVGVDRL